MIKKTFIKTIALATMLMLPCTMTMVQASSMKLNANTVTINKNATKALKVFGAKSKIKWTSNNKKIATVTNTGVVKGISKGTTYVNAKVGNKTLKCKVTVKLEQGSRELPFSAYQNKTLSLYSYNDPKKIQLKLLECIDGDEANEIVEKENMFNEKPTSNNRWVLYHFNLKYLEGNDELPAYFVISDFYNDDSTKLIKTSTASFSHDLSEKGDFSVRLYSGGESDFYVGLLLDNDISYTTFKVKVPDTSKSYGSKEVWFTTKR